MSLYLLTKIPATVFIKIETASENKFFRRKFIRNTIGIWCRIQPHDTEVKQMYQKLAGEHSKLSGRNKTPITICDELNNTFNLPHMFPISCGVNPHQLHLTFYLIKLMIHKNNITHKTTSHINMNYFHQGSTQLCSSPRGYEFNRERPNISIQSRQKRNPIDKHHVSSECNG